MIHFLVVVYIYMGEKVYVFVLFLDQSMCIYSKPEIYMNNGYTRYVMSSTKVCLMGEQSVSSEIVCDHAFVIVFMVNTAQLATKLILFRRYYFYFLPDQAQILPYHFNVLDEL